MSHGFKQVYYFSSKFPRSALGYYQVLSCQGNCTYGLRQRYFITVLAVISILLLGASVWNTHKTPDWITLKVIIYDQLIEVPSAMVGWRGSMSINESNGVTLRLLEALVSGSSVGEAVKLVDSEFGLGGRLVFHPTKAHGFS